MKYKLLSSSDYFVITSRIYLHNSWVSASDRFHDFCAHSSNLDWALKVWGESIAMFESCVRAAVEASMAKDMYCGYTK